MAARRDPSDRTVIAEALSAAVGAALVLDSKLRVVLATADAERLLGFDVPLGVFSFFR